MKLKIAVFNDENPYRDYIFTYETQNENPDDVITTINAQIKGCHCELITVEQENTRS